MNQIRRIMCCCGNGVGSSLMMQMTVEEALDILGIYDIEVTFGLMSEAIYGRADLFVVSDQNLTALGDLPKLGLEDLMDADLAAEALKPLLGIR